MSRVIEECKVSKQGRRPDLTTLYRDREEELEGKHHPLHVAEYLLSREFADEEKSVAGYLLRRMHMLCSSYRNILVDRMEGRAANSWDLEVLEEYGWMIE